MAVRSGNSSFFWYSVCPVRSRWTVELRLFLDIINKQVNSHTNWGRRFISSALGNMAMNGGSGALISIVLKGDRRPSLACWLLPTKLQSRLLHLPSRPFHHSLLFAVLFTSGREISTLPSVRLMLLAWTAADVAFRQLSPRRQIPFHGDCSDLARHYRYIIHSTHDCYSVCIARILQKWATQCYNGPDVSETNCVTDTVIPRPRCHLLNGFTLTNSATRALICLVTLTFDLWPWNWCTLFIIARGVGATFLPILMFMRLFILDLWANTCQRHHVTSRPLLLTLKIMALVDDAGLRASFVYQVWSS